MAERPKVMPLYNRADNEMVFSTGAWEDWVHYIHELEAGAPALTLDQLKNACQDLWKSDYTLICTLPKGHDGDHTMIGTRMTWTGKGSNSEHIAKLIYPKLSRRGTLLAQPKLTADATLLLAASVAERIDGPYNVDEGLKCYRVKSPNGARYDGNTLREALADMWESEMRTRDEDGKPTEASPFEKSGRIQLDSYELRMAPLLPDVLRGLADWHSVQATEADATDWPECVKLHEARAQALRVEADRIQTEWENG